jgi:hypothetical protein
VRRVNAGNIVLWKKGPYTIREGVAKELYGAVERWRAFRLDCATRAWAFDAAMAGLIGVVQLIRAAEHVATGIRTAARPRGSQTAR